jgi:hypothetical protein
MGPSVEMRMYSTESRFGPLPGAVILLDEFLLGGWSGPVELFIDLVRASRWSSHLRDVGLEDGVPSDARQLRRSLLRLRMMFASLTAADIDEATMNDLAYISGLSEILHAYLCGSIDIAELERRRHGLGPTPAGAIWAMCYDYVYFLPFARNTAPSEFGCEADFISAAIRLRDKARSYWFGALG